MPTLQETYHAIVTDNKDPEQRGRLKVQCQGLVGAQAELPDWAEPMAGAYVSNGSGGSLFLPKIGSTVEIICDAHDTHRDEMPGERFLQNPNIKWRPATFTDKRGPMPLPAPLTINYPERRGWVTPGGHQVITDDKGSVIIKSKDGGQIELNLSRRFASGGGASSFETRMEQLRRTVSAVAGSKKVYLNIEGERQ